jgi:hypothetical protein
MSRNIVGWLLITLGLAGIVGGLGMAYVFWLANDAAAQNARTQESMNPGGPATNSLRQGDTTLQYGACALSAVVGLVLLFWGAGLRGSGPRKLGKKDRSRRECPNCGELTPKTARSCFHCGFPF